MPELWRPDKPGEECGIVAIVTPRGKASEYANIGLQALKGRGQESTGIATNDGRRSYAHHGPGLARDVFTEAVLATLPGFAAIGHDRYSTSRNSKRSPLDLAQPFIGEHIDLAHNGNLHNTRPLREALDSFGLSSGDFNDSGAIHAFLDHLMGTGASMEDALHDLYPLIRNRGSANLVLMDKKGKVGVFKDGRGIRPLAKGRLLDGGHAFGSETHALDKMGALFEREMKSGEFVVIDQGQERSYQVEPEPRDNLCAFEVIYIMRNESLVNGIKVEDIRREFGRELAREHMSSKGYRQDADWTVPVPGGGIAAAEGYAEVTGIPYAEALVRNPDYDDLRSFMLPSQTSREKMVELKFSARRELLDKKWIRVIEDSLVRGTTFRGINRKFKAAGAAHIVALPASPPVIEPDDTGMDFGTREELIAHGKDLDEIAQEVGANQVRYLSRPGFKRALGDHQHRFTYHHFGEVHPHSQEKQAEKELAAVR